MTNFYKALTPTEAFSPQVLQEFNRQVDEGSEWQKNKNRMQDFAVGALDEIEKGRMEGYAIVDGDKLIAIGAYRIRKSNELYSAPLVEFIENATRRAVTCLVVEYVASIGQGAGTMIVQELRSICESENMVMIIGSTESAVPFYEKLGIPNTGITLNGRLMYMVHIPKSMIKGK